MKYDYWYYYDDIWNNDIINEIQYNNNINEMK